MKHGSNAQKVDVTKMRKLLKSDMTRSEVAQALGVNVRTVSRYAKKLESGMRGNGSKPLTQEQLDRALYHLQDGCSYRETARTVGCDPATLSRRFPGYAGQGRLNMVEINGKPELKKLHDEIWNMKLPEEELS